MRLSVVQFFKKSVNGHIFRGKYRLVKRVSLQAMNTLQKEYEIQDRNMFLLRHPYLTPVSSLKPIRKIQFFYYFPIVPPLVTLQEESHGHAKALGKTANKIDMWNNSRVTMKPSVTLEERLAHLNVSKSWDN